MKALPGASWQPGAPLGGPHYCPLAQLVRGSVLGGLGVGSHPCTQERRMVDLMWCGSASQAEGDERLDGTQAPEGLGGGV